jgi:hypothetical protein
MNPENRVHYEDWDMFALELLTPQEASEMAAHLASGCASCTEQYLAAKALLAGLATLSPDEPLPAGAEARLRQRLEGELAKLPQALAASAPRGTFWATAGWMLAAAVLLAAVSLGMGLLRTRQELREAELQNSQYQSRLQTSIPSAPVQGGEAVSSETTVLKNTVEQLRQQLRAEQAAKAAVDQQLQAAHLQVQEAQGQVQKLDASLKDAEARRTRAEEALTSAHLQLAKVEADASRLGRASAQTAQIANLLESPALSQLDLKPAGSAQAFGRVFWQDDRGLLLVARDLPAIPEDGSFQLWFYSKDGPSPVNVGVLQLEKPGNGVLFVPPGPALNAMSGALLTEESDLRSVTAPGKEILKVKP